MKAKILVALVAASLTCLLLGAVSAYAQTALDPTMSGAYPKFPAYLSHSCGGVTQSQYGEAANTDGTVTAGFSFWTSCSTGGRGTHPRRYLACWKVKFAADRVYVLDRTQVMYVTWLQGQPAYSCPVL